MLKNFILLGVKKWIFGSFLKLSQKLVFWQFYRFLEGYSPMFTKGIGSSKDRMLTKSMSGGLTTCDFCYYSEGKLFNSEHERTEESHRGYGTL